MSEWTQCNDDVPNAFEVVWIYWRNREVLLGCKTAHRNECEPEDCWYAFDYEKGGWTYYWCRVDALSLDKPNPPEM